jgi:hypothetical protein
MLNGDLATICTFCDGRCPFQDNQPTTAGRHTNVCLRTENCASPFGDLPRFMTANDSTVYRETRLRDVVQQMVNSGVERLVVVDERESPIGVISAWDALAALWRAGACGAGDADDWGRSLRTDAGKPPLRPK